jgi:UDP-N-acetylglucosamine:LPS N-acetylglucosamine transferase
MQGIARRLKDTQLIMICGHNAALAERLSNMPSAAPRLVVGFTSKVRDFMQLSDFFIGKPGPGSISEAIQQGLPVIVVNNTWTMPQERYNAEWVSETRTGIVLDSFKDVRAGVDEVIARLPELRARVARIENRAVFEIPEILGRLLHTDRLAAAPLRDLPRARGLREPHRQTGAPIR